MFTRFPLTGVRHRGPIYSELPLSFSRLYTERRFHVCLLAAISLLVLFTRLHQGDLSGYDDAVYAHEGKQMLATGQWWSVYLNGQLDFDKPPLFVWLEAASMWLFGVTDFAARFPAALLGFGTILLVFFIARELTTSYWLPVWAMMILLCTQVFLRFAMRAMTDVPFTFFFALALFFYLKALKQPRYFLGCGLAISCAALTRSFLGLIPLIIMLAHLPLSGRLSLLRAKHFLLGLLLSVGLPLIWFVSQYRLHGGAFLALHFSFTVDNLPLTNGKQPTQFSGGLLQYPRFLLASYWPWLPLLLLGLLAQCKKLLRERDAASGLLLLWVVCVIGPFSLAEFKWLRYILPVFPAFAILAALPLDQWLTDQRRKLFLKVAYGVLCLTLTGMAANPKYRFRPEELRRLAPIAEAATPPDQRILLYTERPPRDAHLFQVIWYANRFCKPIATIEGVLDHLAAEPNTAVIMDKRVFSDICNAIPNVKLLGETEGFVCWIPSREADTAQAPAQTTANPELN